MRFARLAALAIAWIVFAPLPAVEGQPVEKVALGFLSANSRAAMSARTEALRQGLRELGYVDGDNISIEYQFAEGQPDRLPTLAAELVRRQVASS